MLLEETGQRQQATAMRLNRELNRNAERFDSTIKQVDKIQTRNVQELREQIQTDIIMMERHIDEVVSNQRLQMDLMGERVDRKAEDEDIRKWVTERILEQSEELKALVAEKTAEVDKKVEVNKADMAKYLKYRFDHMKDKQFTVPGLVGEDPKLPYNFLGEYLQETHEANAKRFSQLDQLAKQTAEQLQKLQEFSDYQLKEYLPYQLKEGKKDFKKRLHLQQEDLQKQLKEVERQLVEEWLPVEHQYIEQVDHSLKKLIKHDLPEILTLENQKIVAHIEVAMEHIEKMGTDMVSL
jgi:hypothetical protein